MTIYYPNFKPALSPLTVVSRRRELPLAGEVLVRVGNRVEPDDLVGRTLVPSRGRRFPVAHELGLDAPELHRHLLVEEGSEVEAGDILVRVGRWRTRIWRAPLAGTLSTAEVERGYLIITPPSTPVEVRARLKGFVAAVEPYRAATIQTPAALLQGVFGLGGEQNGVLRTTVTNEADELLPGMLDERATFAVLIGGATLGVEALRRAVDLQVRGIIVGSITEEVLRAFLGYADDAAWDCGGEGWAFPPTSDRRSFPLTLIVTEGLGRSPMCSQVFELLASHDGSEVFLDGRTRLHGVNMVRPQVIIPLLRVKEEKIPVEEEREPLAVGAWVRLLAEPLLGRVGRIVALPRRMYFFDCGAGYRVALVRLEEGDVLPVPLENLEVLAG